MFFFCNHNRKIINTNLENGTFNRSETSMDKEKLKIYPKTDNNRNMLFSFLIQF